MTKLMKAYFAGGCFWGVEYLYQQCPGVIQATSGYMGGQLAHPTYEQVCQKNTGHLETVEVLYDPNQVDFTGLAKLFFEIHDFEQTNGQGPDLGPQYQSAAFYQNDTEKQILLKLINLLQNLGYQPATQLIDAKQHIFYPAEAYHQNYYQKTGKRPYCHQRRPIFM